MVELTVLNFSTKPCSHATGWALLLLVAMASTVFGASGAATSGAATSGAATSGATTSGAGDWQANGYARRAVVQVTGGGSVGVDTAAVRIDHGDATRPDANDFRIFDSTGKPVPYAVTFHDPERYTLISFRSDGPRGTFYIYYDNPKATLDPQRTRIAAPPDPAIPTPGPAAHGWMPKAGLVLITMRRPDGDNPETLADMAKLIQHSPGLDGGAYRRNIADGFNPFGNSDYFISVYRGWLRLPKSGTYGFCTASNEASFSQLDGKTLVDWPGRHTQDRGEYGEKNVTGHFTAGLHYVQYLQEEVLLYQMAFLGYKPPGASRYLGIPDKLFVQPYRAKVVRYEAAPGVPTVTLRPTLIDSLWPTTRDSGQYTRYRFSTSAGAAGGDLKGWTVHWDFGDGQTATGASVEHVFLRNGKYTITMDAKGPKGQAVREHWPLTVFAVEHLAGPFKAGNYHDYQAVLAKDEPAKLPTLDLAELARFQHEAGDRKQAKVNALLALTRKDLTDHDAMDMHLLAAGDVGTALGAWRVGVSAKDLHAAVAQLQAAHQSATGNPLQQLRITARLIRAVGVSRGDVEKAEALYDQAKREIKMPPARDGQQKDMQEAFRDATMALGDAHLWAHQLDKASLDYRTADALAQPVIPPPVRAAQVGSFPQRITDALGKHDLAAAHEAAMQWYDRFPTERLRGEVFFWLGKVALLQHHHDLAIRPLQLAIQQGQGSPFEVEARWLLAEAYSEAGDAQARTAALQGLINAGLGGPFREKAEKALKALATDEHG